MDRNVGTQAVGLDGELYWGSPRHGQVSNWDFPGATRVMECGTSSDAKSGRMRTFSVNKEVGHTAPVVVNKTTKATGPPHPGV